MVWHDAVVTENALTRAIARLRKILGDNPREPRFIETVHGGGFRFLAEVEVERVEPIDESGTEIAGAVEAVLPLSADDTEDVERPSENPLLENLAPRAGHASGRRNLTVVVAGLLVFGLTVLGMTAWPRRDSDMSGIVAADELDPRRIAALPMADLSGRDEDAYFADGLTEQMISTLSRIDGLRVLPRTTVMAYKGTDRRIAEIGRELGAGTVLEGSVRREAGQVRITVQLVDVVREQNLWSIELDRPLRDVFAIQSEVATRVAEALQVSIAPSALERIERRPTREITAWDHYSRGRQFFQQRTRVGLANAIEQYRRALELDPDFALAWAELANGHVFGALMFEASPGWREDARSAAERALEIDPELAQAHRALGGIAYSQSQVERAFELTLRAFELDPSQVEAAYNAASFAQLLGRLDDAVLLLLRADGERSLDRAQIATNLWILGFEPQARELARQVLQEEPLSLYLNIHIAQREMLAGEHTAARERLERLLRAYPNWTSVWQLVGRIEARAGRTDVALEAFDKALESAGGNYPMARVRRAHLHVRQDRTKAARDDLEPIATALLESVVQDNDMWHERWQLAAVAAVRGDADESVRWLAEAVDLGYFCYYLDESDPVFESVRDDPRFQRQLERMRVKVSAMRERLMTELGSNLGEMGNFN